MQHLIHAIDRFTDLTCKVLGLLVIATVLLTTLVVVLRYGFNYGSIALQEGITYLHSIVFMLGAAYALKHNAHVRVDIFYQRFNTRQKAWINALGTLIFLFPLCGLIIIDSIDFVAQAWSIRETSTESGGIAGVYLLKTIIPLMACTLGLQGIAELLRNAQILLQDDDASDSHSTTSSASSKS